jgi:acyl-CoA synthetase (AMP-forming)/AMP-acid ligase II
MSSAPWDTIPDLVADAARRFPDGLALVDHDDRWTFTELEARIHAAARALIASGVEPGERVAVWAPNIPEWEVVALAIHSVGAVLVTINTRFKAKEAAYILGRAGVRRVFTVTDFLDVDYVQLLADEPTVDVDEIVVLRGSPTRCRGATCATSSSPRGPPAHPRA